MDNKLKMEIMETIAKASPYETYRRVRKTAAFIAKVVEQSAPAKTKTEIMDALAEGLCGGTYRKIEKLAVAVMEVVERAALAENDGCKDAWYEYDYVSWENEDGDWDISCVKYTIFSLPTFLNNRNTVIKWAGFEIVALKTSPLIVSVWDTREGQTYLETYLVGFKLGWEEACMRMINHRKNMP